MHCHRKSRKSGAAGLRLARRRMVSSEYTIPVGFEYFGTHQIPLISASAATSRSTYHIRSVFVHWYIDHLKSKVLGYGKMAVVAGHGAKKLAARTLAPGFDRADDAVRHGARNRVIHQIERGIAADNDIFRFET